MKVKDLLFLVHSPAWEGWLRPFIEQQRSNALQAMSAGTGLSEGDYRYYLGVMKASDIILRRVDEETEKAELKPNK